MCVRISSRINNFHVYPFYCNPGHDGSLYDCLLDTMARVQTDDKAVFVFVGDVNAHHSVWLESVSSTDRHEHDAGFEQLVRCPTHIAGNRLDLVMSDATDIVDVFVGTPLGTSDHRSLLCITSDHCFGLSNLYLIIMSKALSF